MGSPQASAAWRAKNPEKVKEANRLNWLRYKANHPEVGIHDTRFKPGHIPSASSGRKFQAGHKINLGRTHNRKHSETTKEKIRQKRSLQVITPEHRLSISQAHIAIRETNHFWKGGITEENKRQRNRAEYKIWRDSVYKRDDYTCQICRARGVELNADHIKPWAYFPELRFDINNGRTLCVPCHRKTDSYKGRATKNYGKVIT